MQAIILAGGFGTRLTPLTYTRSKALLPVMDKALIHHVVDSLPRGTELIVATNYRKEDLERYFSLQGIDVKINDEPMPLGTGGAAKYAEQYIDGTFLVLNGDIISSLNIRKFVKYHAKRGAMATISLWPVQNVAEYGVVDFSANGRIKKFVEKPSPEEAPSNLINAGAYCLEKEVLDYIELDRLVSMEQEIFPQLIMDGKPFFGYTFDGFWIDVGRPTSYLDANMIMLDRHDLTNFVGKESNIQGELLGSCIGNNVKICEKATVISSVIFDGAVVEDYVELENCIVGEGCRIGKKAKLRQVVIGDNEEIDNGVELSDTAIWTKPIPPGYPSGQIGNILRK
jgi:NDP-sugar pyrophosphorylase family protein